jgi:hypothetical protein
MRDPFIHKEKAENRLDAQSIFPGVSSKESASGDRLTEEHMTQVAQTAADTLAINKPPQTREDHLLRELW